MEVRVIDGCWRLPEWFPDLSELQQDLFLKYKNEIFRFSGTINLVSPRTLCMIDLYHFADSILASRIIYQSEKIDEIYDIGSGNGFPGIVFSILFPDVKVVLVEQDERKAEFLKHTASLLSLRNVLVKNVDVSSLPESSVRFAVSRAFASISKSIIMTRSVFLPGGVYFHIKGEEWSAELAAIPAQVFSHWTPLLVQNYFLPVGDFSLSVVKTTRN